MDNLFALRICGSLALENVTQEEIFEELESATVPEFDEFNIEFWDVSEKPPRWVTII